LTVFTEACREAETRVCALLVERGWVSSGTYMARSPSGYGVAKTYAGGESLGVSHPQDATGALLLLPIHTPPHESADAIERFVRQHGAERAVCSSA
jgi:hypothetical protein